MIKRTLLVFCMALLVQQAFAEEWQSPGFYQTQSEDGLYLLTVLPGDPNRAKPTNMILKKRGATILHIGDVYKVNPVNQFAPVYAYVSPKGYVVTLGDWYADGRKHSLVIYDKQGKVLRDSNLEDFLSEQDIQFKVTKSKYSRIWRDFSEAPFFSDGQVHIVLAWGEIVSFRLEDGAFVSKN